MMGMYPISAKEWMVLAEENGYHPVVKQYIQENPDKLFQPMEGIYPRGWEYVSDLLNSYSKSAIVRNMGKVKVSVKEAIGGEAEELLKLYLHSEEQKDGEMVKEVKTFTPILPIGTGPTGANLHEALYEFFNHLVKDNCSDDLFSDSKIEELVTDFIRLTGMNEWEDGEYVVLSDYKIRIETMPVSKFENMHEFEGY